MYYQNYQMHSSIVVRGHARCCSSGQRGPWCMTKAAKFAARARYEYHVLLADADEKVVVIAERMERARYAAQDSAPSSSSVPLGDATAARGSGGVAPAAQVRRRPPRKITPERRALLDERFKQKRMKAKLLTVLPLVRQWAARQPAPMEADALIQQDAAAQAAAADAAAVPPSPAPIPPPSPPPQWSPSWAAVASAPVSASASPRSPPVRGARDERERPVDRSRTPSDSSPGSAHGGSPAPRDTG